MALSFSILISLILQLTLGCNYIDPFGNGYAEPSGSCYSLDYLPMSWSYSCDSTSSFIYSTYSTAECSATATMESTTAVSFNCTGYNSQNQLNNCDVVEYENWLYSENCSDDIYVERKSFVINKCLSQSNQYSQTNNYQMVTCDDSTIIFTIYDNAKCEVNDNNGILYISHPYGDSYRITKCGNQILDYCHTMTTTTKKAISHDYNYGDDSDDSEINFMAITIGLWVVLVILLLILRSICAKKKHDEPRTIYNHNDNTNQTHPDQTQSKHGQIEGFSNIQCESLDINNIDVDIKGNDIAPNEIVKTVVEKVVDEVAGEFVNDVVEDVVEQAAEVVIIYKR